MGRENLGNNESFGKGLNELIPNQVMRGYFKVSEGKGTMGHIAQQLKIDTKWLQATLGDMNNTQTHVLNPKTLVGDVADKYYWGEPRISDEFALVGTGGEMHLYRKRGNTVIYMRIPDENVQPIKKALHALADEIDPSNTLSSDTQSA